MEPSGRHLIDDGMDTPGAKILTEHAIHPLRTRNTAPHVAIVEEDYDKFMMLSNASANQNHSRGC